jgi:two-component system response regulator FixJ
VTQGKAIFLSLAVDGRSRFMTKDLTVHLVDDKDITGQHLTILLVSAGFAVRAYKTASAFLDQLPVSGRACLVMDVGFRHIDALKLLQQMRSLSADIPTIFVTGNSDVATAVQAMKAGAADFIKRPFDDAVLIAAINRAAVPKASASRPTGDIAKVASRIRQLTEREQEVLAFVLEGLQNKMIAFNLGISTRTVEVHRANVMAKMEARNLVELMRMVMPFGETETPLSINSISSSMRLKTTLG